MKRVADFYKLQIFSFNLLVAGIFSVIIALLEAVGVVSLALLLGSFTENFQIPDYIQNILINHFLTDDIKEKIPFILCVILILKYIIVIFLQVSIFILVYRERLEVSKNVLKSFVATTYSSKSQTQSHDRFLRNYLNGVDHVADNFLMALINLVKELTTILLLGLLILTSMNVGPLFLGAGVLFFVAFGFLVGRLIKKLGKKVTLSTLKIYESANDLSRLANYLRYAGRLSYFSSRLTNFRRSQINILKIYGSLQAAIQPLIELLLIIGIAGFIFSSATSSVETTDIGVLLISLIRLIPSGSRITACLTAINYSKPYVSELLNSESEENVPRYLSVDISSSAATINMSLSNNNRRLSIQIEKNQTVKIDGESGSGKTTLLYQIASCCQASNLEIGFVEQDPSFFAGSVLENVTLLSEIDNVDRVRDWFETLGLCENFEMNFEELSKFELRDNGITLSGGQRKKLALVRELLRQPKLLILDELFAGLDVDSSQLVIEFLKVNANEVPVIFTSHSIHSHFKPNLIISVDRNKFELKNEHLLSV